MTTRTIAFALLLAAPSLASANDWTRSFPPKAVGSYLDDGGMRILVAAAGKKDDDADAAEDAAEALRKALRASGRTRVVMDDEALGEVQALDDQRIVARAKRLPVDAVAVVRVFPGAGEARASAVVTLFDKQGEALSAFSAEVGAPLAARGSVGDGVSREAAGAVSHVLREGKHAPPSAAQEEYDRKFVGFLDITGVNQYGAVVGQWTQPFQGKYKKSLDVPEFLDAVDEHDLADEWRAKSRVKNALGVPGAILTGVGALAAILAGTFWLIDAADTCDPSYRDCVAQADKTNQAAIATGVSAGVMVVGIGLLVASGVVKRPDVTPDGAKEMADRHNKRLRTRLGLGDEEGEETAEAPRKTAERSWASRVAVAPTVGAHGGGLALSVAF